jgi:hypothetical protein
MDAHGHSADVDMGRGPVGVDVSWDECPECGTVKDDMGNIIKEGEA